MNKYVLITAAHNEELYIEQTIQSILAQSHLPVKWVIVSDNSTDETDNIIKRYEKQTSFIKYIRRVSDSPKNFASKVYALKKGYLELKDVEYDFIGHLDADITLDQLYYEELLKKFIHNKSLGISGGFIFEKQNGIFKNRPSNVSYAVAGAIQMFRRECYDQIEFIPLVMGGEDWWAEINAKRNKWVVESFPDLKVYHHKYGREARGLLKECLRQGMSDYYIGSDPLFEIVKCSRRLFIEKPYIVNGTLRILGYFKLFLTREARQIPDDLLEFLQEEQKLRLKKLLKGGL